MPARKAPKLKPDVLVLARVAGLDKAIKLFPDDVATAALSAAHARNSMPKIDAATSEPWPPMRTRKMS